MDGKVVVITGAGSGIGRELAREAARRGARLALSDIDIDGLAETVELVRAGGARGDGAAGDGAAGDGAADVHSVRLDVTEQAAVAEYAERVMAHFGVVNLVINNAGIAFTGSVEQSAYKDIARVMDVDYWGVVYGTKEFLPHLIASGDGHLVNVSSIFAFLSVPTQNAYNAAKAAVQQFTESLRMEMLAAGHPVDVSCVHPGGIKTAVARSAGAAEGLDTATFATIFDSKFARTEASTAARVILDGVEKRRARVLVGPDAYVLDALVRLAPVAYQKGTVAISRRFGVV
ncbi:SDR family NAD(P)-dependent oxidoreductase [Rhodococcus sp. IEGM 1408]|uniref:SDR family NAD(P)-dependent oxidoreductase n=1 Tax=Rhodococcus sp. IEGM 1408 TaxID=3082220 RepID=UPI002953D284|nr:SDR family NAD(P)-dependent oxidoreductase [Rhodococcus sp. IEGM 1408]MDV8001917.1 SDR family NAD(P)-dependent oxidoreductase [Rhodococcus sp. IEGM 1408]